MRKGGFFMVMQHRCPCLLAEPKKKEDKNSQRPGIFTIIVIVIVIIITVLYNFTLVSLPRTPHTVTKERTFFFVLPAVLCLAFSVLMTEIKPEIDSIYMHTYICVYI
jgi:heme/copper-type cytochrome/quinol oxidase subunit 2